MKQQKQGRKGTSSCIVTGRGFAFLGWLFILFAFLGCGPSGDRTNSDNSNSLSGESVPRRAEYRIVDLNKIGFSPHVYSNRNDDREYDYYNIPPSKISGPWTMTALPLFRNGVRLRNGLWPNSGNMGKEEVEMGKYFFSSSNENLGLLIPLPRGSDPGEWFSNNKYELRYTEAVPTKPGQFNVVMVIYDACRPDHLSCYGYGRKTSPVLDEIASMGIVFEQAVSQGGWTFESVASILTGLLPPAHGSKYVYSDEAEIPRDALTMAELFAAAGYSTACITTQGIFLGEYGYGRGFDIFDVGKVKDSIEFIRREQGKPFFMICYELNPHAPYIPIPEYNVFNPGTNTSSPDPQSWDTNHESLMKLSTNEEIESIMALYDGELLQNDQTVLKPLWEELKKRDLVDNTLFILTSDHGEAFGEHPGPRTGTWHDSTYEEVIRVPLIMVFPQLITPGSRVEDQVGLIDVLPTLADLLRVEVPEYVQGRSLLPYLSATDPKPKKVAYYSHMSSNNEWHSLRTESWKIIVHDKDKSVELYNLENDPREQVNLANENPEMVNNLRRRMSAVLKDSSAILESLNAEKKPTSEGGNSALRNLGYIE